MVRLPLLLIATLLTQNSVAKEQVAGFDIVTMHNGDIHQGTVAVEFITVETRIGTMTVPYHLLDSLESDHDSQKHLLTTRLGETLIGQVRENRLTMLRVLDKMLPLKLEDIASVEFSSRGIETDTANNPVVLESVAGSRVLANMETREFLVKGSDSIQMLNADDMRSIDLETMDDSSQQVQIRMQGGKAHAGTLMNDRLGFQTNYSEKESIPANRITSVLVTPSMLNGRTDLTHRWHTVPTDIFRDKMFGSGDAPEMVALTAGQYMRGDASGDTDERPPVQVSPGAFALGIFEVTFAEYDKFCTDTRKDCPDDQGWGRGRRPVVNVSWNDAVAYTQWLSRKTRKNYRLPTDAEWEYASRAGSQTTYWWGEDAGLANANCEGCGSPWDGDKSAVTGKFPANSFGLHDTAGNVFEWVADCWHDSFAEAPSDGSAIEKPDCGKRVIRGGAWSFPAKELRSANRWRDFPTRRSDDTGFRVARDL